MIDVRSFSTTSRPALRAPPEAAARGRQHLDGFPGRLYRRNRTAAALTLKRTLLKNNSRTTYLANVETSQ